MIKVEVSGMTTLSLWRQGDVSPVVVALVGASSSGAGGQGEPIEEGGAQYDKSQLEANIYDRSQAVILHLYTCW